MSKWLVVALLSVVAAVGLGVQVAAMVVVPTDLVELTRGSHMIVRGRVTGLDAQWTDDHRRIETVVTLQVAESLKGDPGGQVVFRVPGGQLGRYRSVMPGAPSFRTGEEVVLFLGGAAPALPHLLGLSQGVYRVADDRETGRRVVIPPPLVASADRVVQVRRGDPSRRPPTVEQFTAEVRTIATTPESRTIRRDARRPTGTGARPSTRQAPWRP